MWMLAAPLQGRDAERERALAYLAHERFSEARRRAIEEALSRTPKSVVTR